MKRTPVVPRQESLVLPVVINPFSYDRKLSFCDKLQVAFMTVTIVPIRAILIFFFLVLGWLLAHIALAFRTEEEKLKPMTGWRTWLRPVVLFLCRCLFWSGGLCWTSVKGNQASSKEAPILTIAPHSSFVDALPVVILGLTSVVAKDSSKDIPFFGSNMFYMETVLVPTNFRFFTVPMVVLGRALFIVLGFWVVRRPESAPRASSREAPILVVAHHSTLLDTFLTFYGTYCLPSPVSRVENSHVPFLGSTLVPVGEA